MESFLLARWRITSSTPLIVTRRNTLKETDRDRKRQKETAKYRGIVIETERDRRRQRERQKETTK